MKSECYFTRSLMKVFLISVWIRLEAGNRKLKRRQIMLYERFLNLWRLTWKLRSKRQSAWDPFIFIYANHSCHQLFFGRIASIRILVRFYEFWVLNLLFLIRFLSVRVRFWSVHGRTLKLRLNDDYVKVLLYHALLREGWTHSHLCYKWMS